MYSGTYKRRVSEGRIALPKHPKPILTGKPVIVPDSDGAYNFLSLRPEHILGEGKGDSYHVHLTGGRLAVPKELRKYAGLQDAVAVVGAGSRIELWSPETFAEYSARFFKRRGEPDRPTVQAYPAQLALPAVCAGPVIDIGRTEYRVPEAAPVSASDATSSPPTAMPTVQEERDWLYPVREIVSSGLGWNMKLLSMRNGLKRVYLSKMPAYTDMTGWVVYSELEDGRHRVRGLVLGPSGAAIDRWEATFADISAAIRDVRRDVFARCSAYLEQDATNDPLVRTIQKAHIRRVRNPKKTQRNSGVIYW